MQAEYKFDAADRRRGPPPNNPERALDYREHTDDDKLMVHASQVNYLSKPRHRNCLTEFIIVETPVVSFLVDSVDPSPCLLRRSGRQGTKNEEKGVS
ncbi:hypothetical protein conserved [Leishmania donovani]|uniref:Uncharacterized protein n=3 Tax=Leishmania donovani species complex TaxID=38574 RepID=A4HYR6_LEIIN|nr:hypothetical protein, unknown function [Leishmania infantum JPCM5]XP_003860392.1 hypothetical protein, unknown function [Leishmania donovani]CAC9484235.1 hypothetical_protein_-_conserved [Leishmania infantum]AYU78331.1 hypothetical protein LdCL_200009900 [Leishmania donovani]CAJ1988341.1 hypothetical protein conserved [Leishmania donovani]CAM67454.1 hypothetical protein, unknown function [Leishmania infantum JPCM5]CBZ33685.1 hypothetical protein, unknown function [Leishmania donovani]|eukprot:XP_001465207.1 hypothetical protein, unknown function [Leishmania infantum JPCM5]